MSEVSQRRAKFLENGNLRKLLRLCKDSDGKRILRKKGKAVIRKRKIVLVKNEKA